jgi:hypothetical protein
MSCSLTASTSGVGSLISAADGSGILELRTGAGSGVAALTIDGSQHTSFSQNIQAPNTFGFKNRIINGDMRIDQRNLGASVTPTTGQFSVDRWSCFLSQASKYAIQQSTGSAALGFTKSLRISSLSAYSVAAGDYFFIKQPIEGNNVADLAWGTTSALPVTLSFWVQSSLTGTFGGVIRNGAANRSYPFTYTINSVGVFEYKTITIPGDTTGTWATDNTTGIEVLFGLGVGATYSGTAGSWSAGGYMSATGVTSIVGTNGATFNITGVQLVKGSADTSFDFRDYGRELLLCQRYFQFTRTACYGYGIAGFNMGVYIPWVVHMRATPTTQAQGGTSSNITTMAFNLTDFRGTEFYGNTSASAYSYWTNVYIAARAEL